MMTKEIVVMQKVDKWKKWMQKRSEKRKYPIPTSLRKELMELKNAHMGNLNSQLKFLKKEKYKEYCEANQDKIETMRTQTSKVIKNLNEEWEYLLESMLVSYEEYRKSLEEIYDGKEMFIQVRKGYDWNKVEEYLKNPKSKDNCRFDFDEHKFRDEVLKKDFEDRYGAGFKEAQQNINILEEKFQEAIVFGDIDLVKEIYFTLKDADQFLDRVANTKVI
jgi:hypothetical protein